ncbi:MAG: hypothetical protein QXJ97_13850 [Desulfurococcaceae archaeon]
MKKAVLIAVAVLLAVIIAAPAHALYLEIPASTIDQSYVLNLDPQVWIKIRLKDLVANRSMDNIALTFRDPQLNELFHIYIKTNGEVWYSYQSPVYLGKWRNGTEIYVGLFSDKVVLSIGHPSSSANKTELPVSISRVYDVRVHSNDDTNKAYTAGSIIIEKATVVNPTEVTSVTYSIIPLVFTIVMITVPLLVLKTVLKSIDKFF